MLYSLFKLTQQFFPIGWNLKQAQSRQNTSDESPMWALDSLTHTATCAHAYIHRG